MRKVLLILFVVLFSKVKGQVIDYYDQKLDCDSASTRLEIGWCSKFHLEQTLKEYDSLMIEYKSCLNRLINEDDDFRKQTLAEDPDFDFEYWTDYRKIKTMLIEADSLFKKGAWLDMSIVGEYYGTGRERSIGENYSLKALYDSRIEMIKNQMELNCN